MNEVQYLINEISTLREENRKYFEQMISMQNQMMQMIQMFQQLMPQQNTAFDNQTNTNSLPQNVSAQHEFKAVEMMQEDNGERDISRMFK